MTSRRVRPGPDELLDTAGHSIARAVRQLLSATPAAGGVTHEQLRDIGWQLVQLTGTMSEFATTTALRLDEHSRTRLLRAAEGGDPTESLTTAARELAELRQALEAAESAAREYYDAMSRLVVATDPTLTEASATDSPYGDEQ